MKKDEQGNYSAFDRYRILADVAPYSDQYRLAKKEVAMLNQNNLLSEGQQEEYREIRKQVTSKNKKYNFYERQFKNAKINKETVTVDRVIDQNTFIAKEYPNTPMKLAGVSVNKEDQSSLDLINQVVRPGQKVQVGLDADPQSRIRDDMLGTTRVVVYAGRQGIGSSLKTGENLNYRLSQSSKDRGGEVTIRDDGSAVATHALTSDGYMTIGKVSEHLVHDVLPNIPVANLFSDIFLPVRSSLEEYERQTYSKSFRDWKSPIQGWVRPMLERSSSTNPLQAALHGGGIGYLVGGRKNPWNKAAGFGLTFGVLAGMRSIYDFKEEFTGDGEKWIPKRREKERELDEYFDQVQYIKYKGLYEKAAEMAKKEEGIDLKAYFNAQEERGQKNKNISNYLKEKKKWLTITEKTSKTSRGAELAAEELESINRQIGAIDKDRPEVPVGSYASLALRYKDEYESTLHGAQYHYDYLKIYRAMPKKDKEFFTAFQKAAPSERQQILKLVPKNQRRFYQRAFGLEEDPIKDITEFSDEYTLPDSDWEGWRPEVSLDHIKLKVMREEGMDLTEGNYWTDSEMAADESGVQAIEMKETAKNPLSAFINKGRLQEALEGQGLKDVRISLQASASDVASFNTQLEIERQRENEVEEGIHTYMNQ